MRFMMVPLGAVAPSDVGHGFPWALRDPAKLREHTPAKPAANLPTRSRYPCDEIAPMARLMLATDAADGVPACEPQSAGPAPSAFAGLLRLLAAAPILPDWAHAMLIQYGLFPLMWLPAHRVLALAGLVRR
jgi:hypothetical protein